MWSTTREHLTKFFEGSFGGGHMREVYDDGCLAMAGGEFEGAKPLAVEYAKEREAAGRRNRRRQMF
jgi:hypothetical protein